MMNSVAVSLQRSAVVRQSTQLGHFPQTPFCHPRQLGEACLFLLLYWNPPRASQPPQQFRAPHCRGHLGQLPQLGPALITAKQGQDELPLFIRHLRQASPLSPPSHDSRKLRPPRLSGHIRDSLPEPLVANLVGCP